MPADARVLQRLAAEIAADRQALLKIMAALGIPARSYKRYAAWIGEGPAEAQRLPADQITAEQPGSSSCCAWA